MAEQTFFTEAGVTVTNARFIARGQTYAVGAITSVRFQRILPNRALPTILFIIAGLCLFGAGGNPHAGISVLVFGGLGAVLWYSRPSRYSVRIMTASGESDAFIAKDRALVEHIVQGLNDAIVSRG